MKPDWDAIADQMWLYGLKDGEPAGKIKKEVKKYLREMKEEYKATGKLPEGWETFVTD